MRFSFLLRLPVLLLLVHAYVAWRLAFGMDDAIGRVAVAAMLVVSYLVLMAGFMAREKVGHRLSDAVSWAGFLTLGFFSWLFVLTVLRDVLLVFVLVLKISDSFRQFSWVAHLSESSVWAVLILSTAACLVGLLNARRAPEVKNVDVFIPGLAPDFEGFRIVQVTDLHVGPTIKRGFVKKVVEISNRLDGDVIVLTGDLIDGSVEQLGQHTAPLSDLRSRHGVFAVTGNHEYYAGARPWIAELQRLGVTVLLNEHRLIERNETRLVLAGVTDFGAAKFDAEHASDPIAALRNAPEDAAVRILLAHQPRSVFAAAPLKFDLQLSGHTHGGQFWPWNHFVPIQQPFVAGLHKYQDTQVYVSRGTGYWGPPLRLGARSEITCLRLRQAIEATQ